MSDAALEKQEPAEWCLTCKMEPRLNCEAEKHATIKRPLGGWQHCQCEPCGRVREQMEKK